MVEGVYTKPQWVICGGMVDGKVVLFASKSLTRMELETRLIENDYHYLDAHIWTRPPRYKVELSVSMKEDYVIIHADSYPEAWQALFQIWNPENLSSATELEQRKAINQ